MDFFKAFFLQSICLDKYANFKFNNINKILFINLFKKFMYAYCNIKASNKIFNSLMSTIMFSKMSFFDQNASGRIITRVSDDTFDIDDFLFWLFD